MAPTSAADAISDGKGIFFILLSEFLLAMVNSIVKYVHTWSSQKMMLIRNTVDVSLCLAMWWLFRYEIPGCRVASLLFLRGLAYVTFIWLFWASLKSCLPLGDVVLTVITFSPACLVVMARLLLGEKIPRMWPLQFGLCVIGAVLVHKPMLPDQTCPSSTALLPLASAFINSLMNLASRNVKDVPSPVVCVYNDIVAVVFAVLTSFLSSVEASLIPEQIDKNLGLIVLAGIIGWCGLISNLKGYQSVSVSAIASIAAQTAIPLAYLIQVVVFGEMPDALSAVGVLLIACTNFAVVMSKYFAAKAEIDEQKQRQYRTLPDDEAFNEKAAGA